MAPSKQPQILKISPDVELTFKGPFDEVATTHLFLTNPSDRRVCFKVKTTAPRRYCVRPNSGFIDPSGQVDVSVMLQPLDADAQDKNKHKFMVQSMYASDDAEDVEKLWGNALPGDLMDSKLRCVFQEDGPVQTEQQQSPAASSPPPPSYESVSTTATPAIFAPESDAHAAGDQNELKTLMEECKRLQSENAQLKQKQKEFTPSAPSSKVASRSEMNEQMKSQIMLYAAIAFVLGFLIAYILF